MTLSILAVERQHLIRVSLGFTLDTMSLVA